MNLLFSRKQSNGYFSLIPLRAGAGTIFRLKAQLELNDEEGELLSRYKLKNVTLVVGSRWEAFKRAVGSALIIGILVFLGLLLWAISSYVSSSSLFYIPPVFSILFGILQIPFFVTVFMTVVYYFNEREHITVRDLLHGGRTFRCDSVVSLIQKEAFLENVCEYLRQVLESAKHWQDREVVAIEPFDKAAAKQFVLKTSRA